MDTIPVDRDLLDVCKEIVAGLDRNTAYIPKRVLDAFHGVVLGATGALEHVVLTATTPSDDLIQNSRYEGGLEKDGTYRFGIYAKEGEKGFDVVLTEKDARAILTGRLKEAKVEYH